MPFCGLKRQSMPPRPVCFLCQQPGNVTRGCRQRCTLNLRPSWGQSPFVSQPSTTAISVARPGSPLLHRQQTKYYVVAQHSLSRTHSFSFLICSSASVAYLSLCVDYWEKIAGSDFLVQIIKPDYILSFIALHQEGQKTCLPSSNMRPLVP